MNQPESATHTYTPLAATFCDQCADHYAGLTDRRLPANHEWLSPCGQYEGTEGCWFCGYPPSEHPESVAMTLDPDPLYVPEPDTDDEPWTVPGPDPDPNARRWWVLAIAALVLAVVAVVWWPR